MSITSVIIPWPNPIIFIEQMSRRGEMFMTMSDLVIHCTRTNIDTHVSLYTGLTQRRILAYIDTT